MTRLVIVESPYAGAVERNVKYARAALLDCLRRGEAPIAFHLLYTQVLDDVIRYERELGIRSGLAWGLAADASAVYMDLGVSPGMRRGIESSERRGVPVEFRTIAGWGSSS